MRNYSECTMVTNGKENAKLDIFEKYGIFHIYDKTFGEIFSGTWSGTKKFCDEWMKDHRETAEVLRAAGLDIEYKFTGMWANIHD